MLFLRLFVIFVACLGAWLLFGHMVPAVSVAMAKPAFGVGGMAITFLMLAVFASGIVTYKITK